MQKRKLIISILVSLSAICLIGGGVLHMQDSKANSDGWKRQEAEEVLAEEYIEYLKAKDRNDTAGMKEIQDRLMPDDETVTETQEGQESDDFTDDVYYMRDGIMFTPEYAQGQIECVLEIPKIRLRRGVYEGAIAHDLDIWMTTAAMDSYELGRTHYCIYGHNHPTQQLSFNRLKELEKGDEFTLTNEDGIRVYEITDRMGISRTEATNDIVNNFSIPADKCYLITCGRDEYRYLDLVIEGTLKRIDPLNQTN